MKVITSVIHLALSAILIDTGFAMMKNPDDPLLTKFRAMCATFKDGNRQYAVLWVGDGDYKQQAENMKNKHGENNVRLAGDDFAFAVYPDKNKDENLDWNGKKPIETKTNKKIKQESGELPLPNSPQEDTHTEVLVLDKALEILRYSKQKPDLYLYTRNSPCCQITDKAEECNGGCSYSIQEWVKKHNTNFNTLTVAWDLTYDPNESHRNHREYLFRLSGFYNTNNLKVFHSKPTEQDPRFCAKVTRQLLQPFVLKCLKKKITNEGKTIDQVCKEKDLVKLVNRVTWKCGIRTSDGKPKKFGKDIDMDRYSAIDPKCWQAEIGKKETNVKSEKTAFLQIAAEQCLKGVKKGEVQIGPPLSPDNPEEFSNEVKDLKDLNDQLC